MLHRIFNLRNIYGSIAFLALMCAPGAVEDEMYITAMVLIVIFEVFAILSIKEDGKTKK